LKTLLITRRLPERVLKKAAAHFQVSLRDTLQGMNSQEAGAALQNYG